MDELHDHLVDKMENPDFIRKLYNKPDMNDKNYYFDSSKRNPKNYPIITKENCKRCGYLTDEHRAFKCAVTGRCPGIDFNATQKANAIFIVLNVAY